MNFVVKCVNHKKMSNDDPTFDSPPRAEHQNHSPGVGAYYLKMYTLLLLKMWEN